MLKIGITGGIGSGKSTICLIFEVLGIPIYNADTRAKWLMINHKDLKQEIIKIFGQLAYLQNGSINRVYLATRVFNDPILLKQLNALVHPVVASDYEQWHFSQQKVPYTLKEAALLFESGSYQKLDKIITVFAPKAVRIDRILKRDQTDIAAIEARMEKQMPEEKKIELADFLINAHGTLLIPQVMEIHQKLLKLPSTFKS